MRARSRKGEEGDALAILDDTPSIALVAAPTIRPGRARHKRHRTYDQEH